MSGALAGWLVGEVLVLTAYRVDWLKSDEGMEQAVMRVGLAMQKLSEWTQLVE